MKNLTRDSDSESEGPPPLISVSESSSSDWEDSDSDQEDSDGAVPYTDVNGRRVVSSQYDPVPEERNWHETYAYTEDYLSRVATMILNVLERETISMPILENVDDLEALTLWREQWQQFRQHLMSRGANATRGHAPETTHIRNWASDAAWVQISQQRLYEGDRTTVDQPTNDAAIVDYLLCQGRYVEEAEYVVSEDEDINDDVNASVDTSALDQVRSGCE